MASDSVSTPRYIKPPRRDAFAPSSLHPYTENPPAPGWYGDVVLSAPGNYPQSYLRYWNGHIWSYAFPAGCRVETIEEHFSPEGKFAPAIWCQENGEQWHAKTHRDKYAWVYPWWPTGEKP